MRTILQIVLYCFLFWLPVRCALKDSGRNCLYFYPKEFLKEAQRRGLADLALAAPIAALAVPVSRLAGF